MSRVIYMIRHTAVDVASGTCYGWLNVMPDSSYEASVKALRNKLSDLDFATIYSSPLLRCSQLAQDLFKEEIQYDERLKEMHFGRWEGAPWLDIYKEDDGKRWFDNYLTARCPDGESFVDLFTRVGQFIAGLPQTDEPICIVTHAGVIRAALVYFQLIEAKDAFNVEVPYGGVITIENSKFYQQ